MLAVHSVIVCTEAGNSHVPCKSACVTPLRRDSYASAMMAKPSKDIVSVAPATKGQGIS